MSDVNDNPAKISVVEFLLARIGEREAAAKAFNVQLGCTPEHWGWGDKIPGTDQLVLIAEYRRADGREMRTSVAVTDYDRGLHIVVNDPAHVLAECRAQRRIIELHQPWPESSSCEGCGSTDDWPCETLRALTLPYANHHAYDQDWRP